MTKTQELFYPAFRRWVGRQTGAYVFKDTFRCPMALWGNEHFKRNDLEGGASGCLSGDGRIFNIVSGNPIDFGLMNALHATPQTYEALTKRLDAHYTKTGLRRRQKRRAPYQPTGPLGSFKRGVST